MDARFKVPSIPLVSSNAVPEYRKPEVKRKKSIKSSTVTPKEEVPERNQSTQSSSSLPAPSTKTVRDIFPSRALPKLCPSCSQILVEYLAPIEAYIKQILTLADDRVTQDTPVTVNLQASAPSFENGQKGSTYESELPNKDSLEEYLNGSKQPSSEWSVRNQPHAGPSQTSTAGANNNAHSFGPDSSSFSSNVVESSDNTPQISKQSDIPLVLNASQREDKSNEWQATNTGWSSRGDDKSYSHDATNEITSTHQVSASQRNFDGNKYVRSSDADPGQYHQFESSVVSQSEAHVATSTISQPRENVDHREYEKKVVQRDAPYLHKEYQAIAPSESARLEEIVVDASPYAYVTIAFNNLSAVNAILLANSIKLFNNQTLLVLENDDSLNKKIHTRYYIPTVILLYGSINIELRNIIYQVFDKVIESKYREAVLLNDESLGIQNFKINMWKEMAFQYEKCLFLDAFTIVVGQVSNLFLEAQELSACVDILVPDNFDCSVFVFEPNMDTFTKLLHYGLQLQLDIEETYDALDEMTLLNKFFASKWKKLSFIYNFVRNDMSYTQLPAYFKFGGNVRVANFGSIIRAHDQMSSVLQPWNYKFNLSKAQLEEEPFEYEPVDGYSKFYLRCFMRRVWPLLSQTISPYLLSHQSGRTEWNIFELVQVLSRVDGTGDMGFDQNLGTLRRKKSWVASFAEQVNPSGPETTTVLSDSEAQEDPVVEEQPKDTASDTKSDDESEAATDTEATDDIELSKKQQSQAQEKVKKDWEEGKVDWMGQQRSDNIIDRLKSQF